MRVGKVRSESWYDLLKTIVRFRPCVLYKNRAENAVHFSFIDDYATFMCIFIIKHWRKLEGQLWQCHPIVYIVWYYHWSSPVRFFMLLYPCRCPCRIHKSFYSIRDVFYWQLILEVRHKRRFSPNILAELIPFPLLFSTFRNHWTTNQLNAAMRLAPSIRPGAGRYYHRYWNFYVSLYMSHVGISSNKWFFSPAGIFVSLFPYKCKRICREIPNPYRPIWKVQYIFRLKLQLFTVQTISANVGLRSLIGISSYRIIHIIFKFSWKIVHNIFCSHVPAPNNHLETIRKENADASLATRKISVTENPFG